LEKLSASTHHCILQIGDTCLGKATSIKKL
jgi:hypothetical protein